MSTLEIGYMKKDHVHLSLMYTYLKRDVVSLYQNLKKYHPWKGGDLLLHIYREFLPEYMDSRLYCRNSGIKLSGTDIAELCKRILKGVYERNYRMLRDARIFVANERRKQRRREEKSRLLEQELNCRRIALQILADESRRRAEESRRRTEELRIRDEEMRRRSEELRIRDEEMRLRDEEMRRRDDEEMRRRAEIERFRDASRYDAEIDRFQRTSKYDAEIDRFRTTSKYEAEIERFLG